MQKCHLNQTSYISYIIDEALKSRDETNQSQPASTQALTLTTDQTDLVVKDETDLSSDLIPCQAPSNSLNDQVRDSFQLTQAIGSNEPAQNRLSQLNNSIFIQHQFQDSDGFGIQLSSASRNVQPSDENLYLTFGNLLSDSSLANSLLNGTNNILSNTSYTDSFHVRGQGKSQCDSLDKRLSGRGQHQDVASISAEKGSQHSTATYPAGHSNGQSLSRRKTQRWHSGCNHISLVEEPIKDFHVESRQYYRQYLELIKQQKIKKAAAIDDKSSGEKDNDKGSEFLNQEFRCGYCLLVFAYLKGVQEHMDTHQTDGRNDFIVTVFGETGVSGEGLCEYCAENLISSDLDKHIQTHRKNNSVLLSLDNDHHTGIREYCRTFDEKFKERVRQISLRTAEMSEESEPIILNPEDPNLPQMEGPNIELLSTEKTTKAKKAGSNSSRRKSSQAKNNLRNPSKGKQKQAADVVETGDQLWLKRYGISKSKVCLERVQIPTADKKKSESLRNMYLNDNDSSPDKSSDNKEENKSKAENKESDNEILNAPIFCEELEESDIEIVEPPIELIVIDSPSKPQLDDMSPENLDTASRKIFSSESEETAIKLTDKDILKQFGIKKISVNLKKINPENVKVNQGSNCDKPGHESKNSKGKGAAKLNAIFPEISEFDKPRKQRTAKVSEKVSPVVPVNKISELTPADLDKLLKECGMGTTIAAPLVSAPDQASHKDVKKIAPTEKDTPVKATRSTCKEVSNPQPSTSKGVTVRKKRTARKSVPDQDLILKYQLKEPKIVVKSLSRIEIALLRNPHSPFGKSDWLCHKFESESESDEEFDIPLLDCISESTSKTENVVTHLQKHTCFVDPEKSNSNESKQKSTTKNVGREDLKFKMASEKTKQMSSGGGRGKKPTSPVKVNPINSDAELLRTFGIMDSVVLVQSPTKNEFEKLMTDKLSNNNESRNNRSHDSENNSSVISKASLKTSPRKCNEKLKEKERTYSSCNLRTTVEESHGKPHLRKRALPNTEPTSSNKKKKTETPNGQEENKLLSERMSPRLKRSSENQEEKIQNKKRKLKETSALLMTTNQEDSKVKKQNEKSEIRHLDNQNSGNKSSRSETVTEKIKTLTSNLKKDKNISKSKQQGVRKNQRSATSVPFSIQNREHSENRDNIEEKLLNTESDVQYNLIEDSEHPQILQTSQNEHVRSNTEKHLDLTQNIRKSRNKSSSVSENLLDSQKYTNLLKGLPNLKVSVSCLSDEEIRKYKKAANHNVDNVTKESLQDDGVSEIETQKHSININNKENTGFESNIREDDGDIKDDCDNKDTIKELDDSSLNEKDNIDQDNVRREKEINSAVSDRATDKLQNEEETVLQEKPSEYSVFEVNDNADVIQGNENLRKCEVEEETISVDPEQDVSEDKGGSRMAIDQDYSDKSDFNSPKLCQEEKKICEDHLLKETENQSQEGNNDYQRGDSEEGINNFQSQEGKDDNQGGDSEKGIDVVNNDNQSGDSEEVINEGNDYTQSSVSVQGIDVGTNNNQGGDSEEGINGGNNYNQSGDSEEGMNGGNNDNQSGDSEEGINKGNIDFRANEISEITLDQACSDKVMNSFKPSSKGIEIIDEKSSEVIGEVYEHVKNFIDKALAEVDVTNVDVSELEDASEADLSVIS